MSDTSLHTLEHLAAILQALPDPVFILTRSGRYAAIYGGSDARYFHDGSPLVGKSLHDVLAPQKADWFVREIEKAWFSRELHVVEYGLAGNDVKGLQESGPQRTTWFEGRVKALDFPVLGEDAVLWVASDMTARTELEAQLRLHSETDDLSGLANRRKLLCVLEEHFETFARYRTPTSVLIFDIDHFKKVNDEHGHQVGDKVIAATAEVCRAELRNTDFPARLGGDEFVVLMPHTPGEQAAPIAERLRLRITVQLHALGVLRGGATISGGLSELMPADTCYEDALKRADDALYQAKRDGRDCITRR